MKAKLIFEIPGILSEEQKGVGTNKFKVMIIKILERINTRIADYVICAGENITQYYKQFNDRTDTIINFVDIHSFENDSRIGIEVRKKLGVTNDERLIGVVGPFNNIFNENYIWFIKSNLAQFDERIKILIIGKYSDPIVNPKVINAGFLDSRSYGEYLSAIDVLLVPNKLSTSGPLTKILEAAACGSAAVTTEEGFLGLDYFENNKDIIICPEAKIVERLNEALFADGELKQIGLNAKSVVKKYYSKEAVKRKLNDIIARAYSAK